MGVKPAAPVPRTKREVFGGKKIHLFEIGVKYLKFGATYLSFGAEYLSFVAIYLNLGAVYLNFGEKTLQSLFEGYGVGVGGSPGILFHFCVASVNGGKT